MAYGANGMHGVVAQRPVEEGSKLGQGLVMTPHQQMVVLIAALKNIRILTLLNLVTKILAQVSKQIKSFQSQITYYLYNTNKYF